MGEAHGRLFEPTLNRSIKLRQADPRITSDAASLPLREMDHRLGLTADLADRPVDPRDPQATCRYRKRYPREKQWPDRLDRGSARAVLLAINTLRNAKTGRIMPVASPPSTCCEARPGTDAGCRQATYVL